LSSGNSFKLDVTDPDFTDGKSPIVTVEAYIASDVNCTVTIKYHTDNGTMKTAKTMDYNYAGTIGQKAMVAILTDAYFGSSEDIVIEISGDSPLLNYVAVSKKIDNTVDVENYSIGKIHIYPNPAIDFINISNVKTPINYEVTDLVGRTAQKGILDNSILNVSRLMQGMYFLKLDNNKAIKFLKK
jgi:hypothetical protein